MDASDLQVGKTYANSKTGTAYRLESIDDGRITATPLRGKDLPKQAIGRIRTKFISAHQFANWCDTVE